MNKGIPNASKIIFRLDVNDFGIFHYSLVGRTPSFLKKINCAHIRYWRAIAKDSKHESVCHIASHVFPLGFEPTTLISKSLDNTAFFFLDLHRQRPAKARLVATTEGR